MTALTATISDADVETHAGLINGVKQAVVSTFTMICGAEPSCENSNPDEPTLDGMVGIISFVGDLSWCLMLGLPRETSTKIATAFAGFEIEYDSDDMGDLIGELANVLAGAVVERMEAIKIKAQMSLPTVARGHDVQLLLPHALPFPRMTFDAAQGKFWVKVVVAQHR
jgi:CheY-specific phosphatase CheX